MRTGEQAVSSRDEEILSVRNLTKIFGQATAVDTINFTIKKGEVLTLLGHSGSGKSTTLRMIAGLERPDSGSIILRGEPVASVEGGIFIAPEKRQIGLVFQSYAVWPHMSVAENIGYPLKIRRVPRDQVRARVEETCDLVGMRELIDRPATQLSGGQQQRVALGRAIIHEPDLLLLDEPFSNLDTQLREELRHYMKYLQRRLGMSVLYVTHDQTEAMALSDRVAVMYKGKIDQIATPEGIYERPKDYFIQRFVGKVLCFYGEVSNVEDAEITIAFPDATTVKVPHPQKVYEKNASIRLVVRPEDVSVAAAGAADTCCISGEVQEISYLGSRKEYTLRTSGGEVVMPLPKSTAWKVGDHVTLVINPDKVHVWPGEGK